MPNGNGGGGGFDFGGIFDPLLGVLAAVVQAIIDFLNALVGALVQVLNFLLAGEQGIFGFSFQSLSEVWRGLKNIIDQVFKISIVAALKHLLSLYQKLAAWVRKLKDFLERWRRLQQLYQVQALKRVINLIQRIRQVLVIFRIFHAKWARKLDDWLAGIEGKLITRVSEIQRKTNEIVNWINFIADPTKLLRLAPMAQSIYRYLRGLRGVLGIPESRALTVDEETRQAQDRALLTAQPHLEDAAVQRIMVGLDGAATYYLGSAAALG